MNERLKTHSKTQKKSADLVSNKLRIGVFQRYQMKCKSVSKKSPRYNRGASGGSGWRLAPRNNFMVETLEKNRSWTRYFLARELRKSLKPERRHR
ncbi:hypothetical protein NPL56_004837 [Escherichia coli]|nr:hypothetical protein [Escherichia coli]